MPRFSGELSAYFNEVTRVITADVASLLLPWSFSFSFDAGRAEKQADAQVKLSVESSSYSPHGTLA